MSTNIDNWFTYCVLSQQNSVSVEFVLRTLWLRKCSVWESKIVANPRFPLLLMIVIVLFDYSNNDFFLSSQFHIFMFSMISFLFHVFWEFNSFLCFCSYIIWKSTHFLTSSDSSHLVLAVKIRLFWHVPVRFYNIELFTVHTLGSKMVWPGNTWLKYHFDYEGVAETCYFSSFFHYANFWNIG